MGLYPRNLNEYVASLGIPRGPKSKAYLYDPVNGDDNNPGTSWLQPLKTLTEAEDHCVADQHDAVLALAGDTADNPAAAIAWDKDYTHLIGVGCNLHGIGQRCRIVGTAALDLTPVITFSGNGCMVRDVQIYNGKDADTDSGAAIVSGSRNKFSRVLFTGMAHATPAARAGSYSLKLTGSENEFEDGAIGLDTVIRAAANAELWISGSAARNSFRRNRIFSYSETAGKVLVLIDGMDRWVEFEDCVFQNFWENWGGSLTNAMSITATSTHQILMKGKNLLVGVSGWANTVTHIYSAEPAPNAGFGIGLNPTS
jgi:hypothetical protein